MKSAALALSLAMLLIAACGSTPPLPAKPATVPDGLDLSGDWTMRDASRSTNRRIRDAERNAAGPGESLIPGQSKRSGRGNSDVQVHVFLESGELLRITQTDYGLFISFDRAIVEEYRFGEQRMISVGPIQAERVSGWENNAYVIETRDKNGTMLIESYRLQNPDSLVRSVEITGDPTAEFFVQQVFDRR
ncbi:MAG: hypothetical protein QNI96_04805 [Woeseiaceae bacterium]|nr:hypothetical protein [Woeseiaceae bacterium]